MKNKSFLFVALATVLALASCKKDYDQTLSVNQTSLSFVAKTAPAQTVAVTSNCDWQASASVDWITVSPTSGNGSASVSVSVSDNSDTQSRTGVVKFTYGNAVVEVAVEQLPEDNYFNVVSYFSNPVTATAQNIKFVVTANVDCSYEIEDAAKSWISVVDTKTVESDTVFFAVAANTGSPRSGKITFKGTGVTESFVFSVEQNGSDPTKITTAAEFIAMLATPQTEEACDTTYTIMNDIDFSGYVITVDNCFKDEFYANIDGQGHKFTNYTASADMIQKLYGTFKDLTIESGSFTLEPDHSCGIFFEQIEKGGVAENLVNKAEITGNVATTTTFHQGALCGLCRGVMKNCKNYGNATISLTQNQKGFHYRFGGIAGSTTPNDDTYTVALENCENHGNIEIECVSAMATTYIGGITAVADSKECDFNISGCVNTGKISMVNASGYQSATAKVYAGGLVGQRNEGDIKNCSNTGDIDLTELNFDYVFAGGLIAFQKGGYWGEAFQNCTVNANVKASFLNATSTTANPLANAGMIIANVGDAGVTFGGVGDNTIKVGGALYNGETKIDVNMANVSDLTIGSACTYAPTFNISLAQ